MSYPLAAASSGQVFSHAHIARRYGQARALATIASFAVNVITI